MCGPNPPTVAVPDPAWCLPRATQAKAARTRQAPNGSWVREKKKRRDERLLALAEPKVGVCAWGK